MRAWCQDRDDRTGRQCELPDGHAGRHRSGVREWAKTYGGGDFVVAWPVPSAMNSIAVSIESGPDKVSVHVSAEQAADIGRRLLELAGVEVEEKTRHDPVIYVREQEPMSPWHIAMDDDGQKVFCSASIAGSPVVCRESELNAGRNVTPICPDCVIEARAVCLDTWEEHP